VKRSLRILSILLLICTQIFFFSGIQYKAYPNESNITTKVFKNSDGNSFPIFNAEEENLEEDEDEFLHFYKEIATPRHSFNADIFKNKTGYKNSKNLYLLSHPIYKSFSVYRI
jgi:hypothetical protein